MRVPLLVGLIGLAFIADAGYLHAKAALGQWLLARAWDRTRATGIAVKPWPWADLHPIARLSVPRERVELLVLEGASGATLAWGPAHVQSSPAPGAEGNAVITGHRDTHFAFLRRLAAGERIVVEGADGLAREYVVAEARVADARALRIASSAEQARLTLVTCYPFDAVNPGTRWRYVVVADATQRARTLATR